MRIEKLNVGRSLCLFRAVTAKGKAVDAFKNYAFFCLFFFLGKCGGTSRLERECVGVRWPGISW